MRIDAYASNYIILGMLESFEYLHTFTLLKPLLI